MSTIRIVTPNDLELLTCFSLMSQLRPGLSQSDYLTTVKSMYAETNYLLIALYDNDEVVSVAGFRVSHWLHTGKYLEIEDFITSEQHRSKSYGSQVFEWCKNYAIQQNCRQIRLVSGVTREKAHKFYRNKGMEFEAKYFSLNLQS